MRGAVSAATRQQAFEADRFAVADDRPGGGFRLVRPDDRNPGERHASGRPAELHEVGAADAVDKPAQQAQRLPAIADALPMDGTWRGLGLLSCWLSAALVTSFVVFAIQ